MSLLTNAPRDIERFIQDRRGAPVRLYECESTALPDPAKWRGGLLSLTDTPGVAYSDGSTWTVLAIGGVSSSREIATEAPLTGGGDLSADRTIGLEDSTVTPGSYTHASITVDDKGIVTAAASGAAPPWVVAASWAWSTNVANVDLTGLGGYSELLITASGLTCSSSTDRFVRVSTDGGSTFHSTGYSLLAANGTVTSGTVAGATSGSTTAAASLVVHIPGSNINGAIKACHTLHVPAVRIFSGSLSPIDAIRVAPSAGNLTAGSITVLGRP